MITVVKMISNSYDSLGRLISKFQRMGKADIQEVITVGPFGVDSRAIKDMVAIHAQTGVSGESVVIGFINKDCIAAIGENRIFSTDENGILSTYIHLKNDQTMEIGGNTDFMVRYSELENAFDQLKSDHNQLAQKWDSFCSLYTPGSPSTVGTPPTLATSTVGQSTADITGAKIEEIKTL